MRELIKKYPWQLLSGLVLLVGAILRLYDFNAWSLSNDELSALNRIRFSSMSQLLDQGVRLDFHPAGVQVFLYLYTKIFGLQPFMIRLPFVLAGIASVWLTYLIGKQWFSKTTGLISAMFLAFLPYLLLYSQLARPYSFGLVFTLAAAYYWGKFFIIKDERKSVLIWFSIFSALAVYMHHFSFMMIGLFALAGFLYVKKSTIIPYLVSLFAIGLLYLPHLGILMYQLSIGGVGGEGGWLAPPDNAWLWDYLFYAFGSSAVSLIILIGILVISFAMFSQNFRFTKIRIIAFCFFALPFIIGFFYSLLINPVLQFSVMLFAFPFLLILLFSFINDEKLNLTTILIICGLGLGSWVAVDQSGNYRNGQFADFQNVAKKMQAWDKLGRNGKINFVTAINHPYYLQYFFDQQSLKTPPFTILESKKTLELADLVNILDTSGSKYFSYLRLKPAPPEIPDIIAGTYPYLIESVDYYGQAEAYLFSKEPAAKMVEVPTPVTSYFCDFEKADEFFEVPAERLDTGNCISGQYCMKLLPGNEWGPGIKIKTGDANLRYATIAKISVDVFCNEQLTDCPIVFSVTDRFSKAYIWSSGKIEYYAKPGKWSKAYLTVEVPHPSSIDDELKIFVWNKEKKELLLDDFSIRFYKK